MYILKNSMKNLLRNKGRNIIVAIIILAMLIATAVSMIINTTTSNIIEDYKQNFGSKVYIQTNPQKFKEYAKDKTGMISPPDITDEQKLLFAESEYLKETQFIFRFPAYSSNLKGIDQGRETENGNVQYEENDSISYYNANLNVIGYSSFNLMEDFKDGTRQITEGDIFKNKYECIISEDFAKLNNLKIGDFIEAMDCDVKSEFAPLKLKVVGVYFDTKKSEFGNWISAATNPKNDIITSFETMDEYKKVVAKGKNIFSINATFYLKNPDMLDAFNKEAHSKGLHDIYDMSTDSISYNQIVKPVEGLAKTSTLFLIIVLIFGSVILVLLSILSIRERKYEIGVLRAMGMKKSKVVRGIIYESLITIAICLILGLTIGMTVAQPVSDMMMQNQVEISKQNNQDDMYFIGSSNVEDTVPKIDVSLSPKAIANVSAIALLLALMSSSVGILYITRYEPMKILSERN